VPLSLIPNFDFEDGEGKNVKGWKVTAGDIRVTSPGYESQKGLRITNKSGVATVYSKEFEPPESRQMAISFRVRSLPHSPSPNLRISIESDGRSEATWPASRIPGQSITAQWSECVLPLTSLAYAGAPVSLRIDLVGAGDVEIDDIKLYDSLLLRPLEQRALAEQNALADYKLRYRLLSECLWSLQSYWPRYLMEYVPEAPAVPTEMTMRRRPALKSERTSSKWRRWLPKWRF
jgi:hypothetical protein